MTTQQEGLLMIDTTIMTKIIKSCRNISAFGGINFVIDLLEKSKIPSLLDKHLGNRVKQATYSYSEIILSWIYANFCGAERLEDIMNIKSSFEYRPGFKCPSSDRISDVLRTFTTETQVEKTDYSENQININMKLNKMMLDTAIQVKQVNKSTPYTIDYDNVLIFNNKYDSRLTYKKEPGYAPGVLFIDQVPVYIENRNGNSHAALLLDESVERGINLLRESNVKIDKFRSDSAAYSNKVFSLMDRKGIKFFIRARTSAELISDAKIENKWKKMNHKGVLFEVTSVMYQGSKMKNKYRYVVYRRKAEEGKKVNEDGFHYQAIITSDYEMDSDKVIRFYNQRGAIERNFDDLKNNFNWSRLPFSFLNENTVFLIISAISSILYRFCLKQFSSSMKFVKRNWRLKNFRFHFINIAAWWVEKCLYVDTDKDYG